MISCKNKEVLKVSFAIVEENLESGTKDDHVLILKVFQRLMRSKDNFAYMSKLNLIDVFVDLLTTHGQETEIVHECLLLLKTLLDCPFDTNQEGRKLQRAENNARDAFRQHDGYDILVVFLSRFADGGETSIVLDVLSILYSVLVVNYHRRKHQGVDEERQRILCLLHDSAEETLFALTSSELSDIRLFSSGLLKASLTTLDYQQVQLIQQRALEYGLILWHFLYSMMNDPNYDSQIRVSRDLVQLLTYQNDKCMKALSVILPPTMFAKLSPNSSAAITDRSSSNSGKKLKEERRERAMTVSLGASSNSDTDLHSQKLWQNFWKLMDADSETPTLRWNDQTREELREGLRSECELLKNKRLQNKESRWEWESMEVEYKSIGSHVLVGGYYIDILIHYFREGFELENNITDIHQFFKDLYDQCVIEDDDERKLLIIKIISILYERYDQFIRLPFLKYLVWLLKPAHYSTKWRRPLLILLKSLLQHPVNQKEFVLCGGIDVLIYHLNMCHTVEKDAITGEKKHPILIAKFCLLMLETLLTEPLTYKRLAKPVTFQYITQAILLDFESFEIVNLTAKLMIKLLERRKELIGQLYKTGMFSFIIAALEGGCSPSMVSLMKNCHFAQNAPKPMVEEGPDRKGSVITNSYLSYFFPQSMIQLLIDEEETIFASLLQSKCMRSNVIWGEQHLALLTSHVQQELQEFRDELKVNPEVLYEYVEPKKVIYPDLEEQIVVNEVYLTYFNQDRNCVLDDKTSFIRQLILLVDKDKSESYLLCVLTALSEFVKRFGKTEEVVCYTGFDRLLSVLDLDLTSESSFLLAYNVLHLILKLITITKSKKNLQNVLNAGIIDSLAMLVQKCVDEGEFTQNIVKLVEGGMRILVVVVESQESTLDITQHSNFLSNIVSLLKPQTLSLDKNLAYNTVQAVTKMGRSRALAIRVIEEGGLLYLLKALIPTSDSEFILEQQQLTDDKRRGKRKRTKKKKRGEGWGQVYETVVVCIQELVRSTPNLKPFLSQIFPSTLSHELFCGDAIKLVSLVHGTIDSPTLIWNHHMWHELHCFLDNEIASLTDQSTRWLFRNLTFKYETLASEVIVGGYYIRPYTTNTDFFPRHPVDFLIALLDAIEDGVGRLSGSKGSKKQEILVEEELLLGGLVNLLKCGTRSSEDIMTVLASLSQTVTMFKLLIFKDSVVAPGGEKAFAPSLMPCLNVIAVMSKNGSCIGVLKDQIVNLHWLLNSCSNSPPLQCKIFQILGNLTKQSAECVKQIFDSGLCVSMLAIFCGSQNQESRTAATTLIGTLVKDKTWGDKLKKAFLEFFVPHFEDALMNAATDPYRLMELYDGDNETPFVFWNNETRKDLVNALIRELAPIIASVTEDNGIPKLPCTFVWDYQSFPSRYKRPSLTSELRVGGYYVRFFNKYPGKFIRSLQVEEFFESLLFKLRELYQQEENGKKTNEIFVFAGKQ
eukprot:CAMPEP_0174252274 /NCGR_PEP_ID=MMETSP0439-20130205/1816_1 /TAXON_ID=0 /ORGANISM="Stereomyxa ramosa, Strain Chinc5" /LENGTH=1453 /DNA_ID=CAMNT_0015332789 /DNA_START=129 /DNA_END=4491 /DNA_ORIENTATION=+